MLAIPTGIMMMMLLSITIIIIIIIVISIIMNNNSSCSSNQQYTNAATISNRVAWSLVRVYVRVQPEKQKRKSVLTGRHVQGLI